MEHRIDLANLTVIVTNDMGVDNDLNAEGPKLTTRHELRDFVTEIYEQGGYDAETRDRLLSEIPQTKTNSINDLITAAEAAQILGITDSRLRQLRAETGIGTQVGRDWFYGADDLAKLAARPDRRGRPGRKRFSVERTDRPFGILETPHGWRVISEHATLSAAKKRVKKERDAMHAALGPNTISGHFRIVALHDTEIKFTCECRECYKSITVTVDWPKGDPMPTCPIPDGWDGHSECHDCHNAFYKKMADTAEME